jgi:hypothetical protein
MCEGRRLVADFVAGTDARPSLPEAVEEHLTPTADGLWVVWAYKLARQEGEQFVPLTGPPGYPAVARAFCRGRNFRRAHDAPDPTCTCGFHALSSQDLPRLPVGHGFSVLTVALYGRVLAFEWAGGGMLWRAERQSVVRVEAPAQVDASEEDWWPVPPVRTPVRPARVMRRHPDDPEGRLAAVRPTAPRDSGPIRLKLPVSAPTVPVCHDDAGWCVGTSTVTFDHSPASLALV